MAYIVIVLLTLNKLGRIDMKQKIIAIMITMFSLLLPMSSSAGNEEIPSQWKAPGSLSVTENSEFPSITSLYFSVDSALLKFINPEQTDHKARGIDTIGHTAQIDWKLNDGKWHYAMDWDTISGEYPADSGI